MKSTRIPLALVVAMAVYAAPAWGALGVGDPAPPLKIAEWVQGSPVDLQKEFSKRVHLIEFWAVWCPPCKMSVPRLTEIQNKHGDKLRIIGVTAPDMRGNSPSAIRKFVSKQGKEMVYHVAIDDREGTTESYMVAANAMGIPHAFLVDRSGIIAWQGSPLDPAMAQVIDGLVRGTYDPKLEAELDRRFRALEWPLARGQWNVVIEGLTDVLKIAPGNETALRALQRIHIDELGQAATYRDWARAYIDQHRDNAMTMHMLATILIETDMSFQSAPELALEAAQLAFDASKTPDASILSLYALAHYRIGDLERAITFQKKAVELASGNALEQAQALHEFYNKCKTLKRSRS